MVEAVAVGVDVGGTKTHIRAVLPDGREEELLVPTARWRPVEQERDAARLIPVIASVCTVGAATTVALGVHGCDTRSQCREFADELGAHSPARFHVVNDAELLIPAAGFERGLGVVVGTGSIVVGQDADGDLMTAGGWGWQLGDPASAAALVRQTAAALLDASDRGRVADPARTRLFVHFGVASERELAYTLTASGDVRYWADAAPAVFDAAAAGSALARGVLVDQADLLVAEAVALKERGAVGEAAVIGGGIVAGQPGFARMLVSKLRAALGMDVAVFDGPPVVGALALARRIARVGHENLRSERQS